MLLKMLWNSGIIKWQFCKNKDKTRTNQSMLKKESSKLKDFWTYLKYQVPLGPFSTDNDVCSHLDLTFAENAKNKRLHVEVQYARVTSVTLNDTATAFHLKKQELNNSQGCW